MASLLVMMPQESLVDWRLLHNACWAGDAKEVERLLTIGVDPNRVAPTNWRQRPLHRTLEFRISHPKHDGHFEVVKLLLAAGADPAVRATSTEMTPWELACFSGFEPAEKLLRPHQRKAVPHPEGMSELWLAAASRLPETAVMKRVGALLDEGADPNAIWRQTTPLMMAAAHAGHFKVADLLLARGADPNAGVSLLHAVCAWHLEHLTAAVEFMAGSGWNVNNTDPAGQTALHKAAFLGYAKAAGLLLSLGANPAGALQIARRHRKAAVMRLLNR